MVYKALLYLSALGVASAAKYGYNSLTVLRDTEIVAANFPDTNVTLLAPAFQTDQFPAGWTEGTEGPTPDVELEYFISSLAARNPWMTFRQAEFESEEGRSFPYVYLSKSPNATKTNGLLRVWLQGGVHGNEPAGDQGILALLGKMDAEKEWASSLLDKMNIILLPRYNVDGVFYFQRTLATNYDPNRDHIKLAREQTRAIKRLFTSFNAHIAVDMHEFSATTPYGTGDNENLVQASDALYAAAKNLNIHSSIRNLSETLFAPQIGRDLEAGGFRWEPYVTQGEPDVEGALRFDEAGSDAKIGRNAMGLTQAIVFLTETRGIYLAEQEFQRRTACGLAMVQSIVQTAADNAESVYATIEDAIEDFVTGGNGDVVVTDYTTVENRTFQMVELETGNVIDQPIEFASTTPTTANLTRTRPTAYIIPKAWRDLVDRLTVYGVESEEIPSTYIGTVEALNVTAARLARSYYEGVVLSTVETEPVTREVRLPAGSYRVPTAQKNAALAFNALEPENIDSFVSFNIIPLEVGDEYPIFRVI